MLHVKGLRNPVFAGGREGGGITEEKVGPPPARELTLRPGAGKCCV